MVAKARPGRKARVPFKVVVALFAHEWDELKMEANARGITGGELIGSILSRYIASMTESLASDGDEDPPQDA